MNRGVREMAAALEEIAARAEGIVAWAIAKATPTVAGLAYRVKVEGWRLIDKESAAIFVVKHTSMVDFAVSTYAFQKVVKKQAIVPVKEVFFRNNFLALILKELWAEPMTRTKDKGYMPQSAERTNSNRRAIEHLRNRGWYAYCPEGTRVKGAVGIIEPEFIHPLIRAERQGAKAYVVGFEYQTPGWLPRLPLWAPLLTKVIVRCEPYEAGGKGVEEVTAEVRAAMARLSGLEGRVAAYSASAAERTAVVSRRI